MHSDIILPTFGLPIHTALMLYISIGLILFSYMLKARLNIIPGTAQIAVELIMETFIGLAKEIMGHKGRAFVPLILTFFIFILVSNAFGMVPGFVPPTANLNTTLGLALIVFVLTHIIGLKEHGASYIKQFTGPILWLAPLMFFIEIFGHLARPISLSMRLFGNMMGHEMLIGVLLILMPYAYPLLAFVTVLGVLVVVIQAFIFSLLAMAYLGGALEEAH